MSSASSYVTPDPLELKDGESAVERLSGGVLADLLDGAREAGDPAKRDYGERYTYLGVLGEGGQGVVVRARDNLLEREVAIKALKDPNDETKELILEREARLCGQLEHPNILPTYDLCQDEIGSPFFVMKKIEGMSLEDLLKRDDGSDEEVSQRRLIEVFLQVCHAIEYAHSRGVFHLDLKPANVVIGAFSEVYVLDWGFAAKVDEELKYLAGTPLYIAPERLIGKAPDARSDVYSLGVMLYRILTRQLPRDVGEMSFRDYRRRFREVPVVPPRQRDRSIPRDLEAIVMKALADDPDERYPSASAFATDLERFLDVLPVLAAKRGLLDHACKFMWRHRVAMLGVTALLAALALAGLQSWRSMEAERRNQAYQEELRRREEAVKRRARARVPLEKASEHIDQYRDRVEKESERDRRRELLAPAFALLDEAITLNPDDAEVFYERGRAHMLARDFANALTDFQSAYHLDESYIMAHYFAGKILADVLKRTEDARREFERMEQLDPDNEYSQLGQAYLDLNAGHYNAALARCDRIAQFNAGLADIYYIRGLVLQRSKEHRDLQGALEAYSTFIEHRQDNPSAFLNRGDIRREMEDYDGAIADYTAALGVQPDYKWALRNRGYVLYKFKKRPLQGLADIERALAIDDRDAWAWLEHAAISEALGRSDAAEKDYLRALELAPDEPTVQYRMGVFRFHQGRLDESERYLTHALALGEGNRAPWLHRRGIVRLAAGRYADAVRDFEESIRLRDDDKIYPALMRWVALALSGVPVDATDFERQLTAPPGSPWLAALGAFYAGDIDAGEVMALATTPEARCESHFYIGAHAYACGAIDVALQEFRDCIATGVHLYMEYGLAVQMLKKIESGRPVPVDKEK